MFTRWLGIAGSVIFLVLPLWACDYGYDIVVTVTAPVDVQRAFSQSRPGLVVDNSTVIGRLCSPTSSPVVFKVKRYPIGVCSSEITFNDGLYGNAYVFDPTNFQIKYPADGDADAVKCGETSEVHGRGGYDVQISDVFPPVTDKDKVATGAGKGACTNATYGMEINLSLR